MAAELDVTAPAAGPERRARLFELDFLRFIAAAAVVLYHYVYTFSGEVLSGTESLAVHGHLGVEVFFVISGFVVLWSCRGRSPMGFARARVLRLYPEFWLCVLISASVFLLVPGGWGDQLSASVVMLNLTMLPSYVGAPTVDGVYWTLAVEIKFYVLLWTLHLLRQMPHIERWLYGWLLVSLAGTLMDVGPVVRSLSVFPYGPLFASGGVFFLVHESGFTRGRVLALTLGLALACYHSIDYLDGFVRPEHIHIGTQAQTVGIITAAFVFFAGVGRMPGLARYGGLAALVGGLTYPVYLLHNVGREMFLGHGNETPTLSEHFAAVTISVALAYFVMRVGETIVRPRLRSLWDNVGHALPAAWHRTRARVWGTQQTPGVGDEPG